MFLLLAVLCAATASPEVEVSAGGHIKSISLLSLPHDHVLLPDDPWLQGALNSRLWLEAKMGDAWAVVAHPTLSVLYGPSTGGSLGSGVGRTLPQAVPLTVDPIDTPELTLRIRTDRLGIRWSSRHVALHLGRQPFSSGAGKLFTPLDLVAPFTPALLDTEYKPGVDAFRSDVFIGSTGRITALAAYLGSWDAEGVGAVLTGGGTVGTTDLTGFAGWLYGDLILGGSVSSTLGSVTLYADGTATLLCPEDPFGRIVAGIDWVPTATTLLTGEVYLQTLGEIDPTDLPLRLAGPRYARGELWLGGIAYAGLSLGQQLAPLWTVSLITVANLTDPSALLLGSLEWEAAQNAELSVGVYTGVGARDPEGFASELGLIPFGLTTQLRIYF